MSNYRRRYEPGSYIFVTIVTASRNPILIKNIDLLLESARVTKNKFKFEIFGIVVLPGHIHAIFRPENIIDYPNIIKSLKYHISSNIDDNELIPAKSHLTESKIKKHEKGVWQRRYLEHTIRDELDLYRHLEYIHYNPVKHGHTNLPKDWSYSSFYKFVKNKVYDENWGSSKDVELIKDIYID